MAPPVDDRRGRSGRPVSERRGRPASLRDVGEDPDPRFTFANERTFLAWNRTALALIGGGLAAGQLLEFDSELVRLIVALPPILLGGLLAAGIAVVGVIVTVALVVDAIN